MDDPANQSFNPRQLVLFLNGFELEGVNGEPTPPEFLAFKLERTATSRKNWNKALNVFDRHKVTVGVGCPGRLPIAADPQPQLTILLFTWKFWSCLILLLFTLFIFFRYCRDALRSSGLEGYHAPVPDPKVESKSQVMDTTQAAPRPIEITEQKRGGLGQFFLGCKWENKNPFSLSLSQLAFWTFLIFGSYLLIYGVTGDFNNILTQQALILLGITGVTALGTSLIDGKNGEEGKKGTRGTSENFFRDILSDLTGVNFHRFQAFIWTLALGLIFLWRVATELEMPDFDATLLALQGISAGTFLGLRGQEQHGDPQQPGDQQSQPADQLNQPAVVLPQANDGKPSNNLPPVPPVNPD